MSSRNPAVLMDYIRNTLTDQFLLLTVYSLLDTVTMFLKRFWQRLWERKLIVSDCTFGMDYSDYS